MKKFTVILVACLLTVHSVIAQTKAAKPMMPDSNYIKNLAPRPSPMSIAKTMLGDKYVKVVYSRPFKKGRKIFGTKAESAIVPYGEVWRTGANEATELTTTADLNLNGKTLKAGTYSVFTIPQQGKWTVIFNSVLGQWGAYSYAADKDVLRLEVPATAVDSEFEAFTIGFENTGDGTNLVMVWDKTKVSVPIKG